MFTIDGVRYDNVFVQKLTRNFQIKNGANEGYSLNGTHIRDITGEYLSYTLTLDASLSAPEEYDRLFETISAPVEQHTVVFPYGQSVIQFDAEITDGGDDLAIGEETQSLWQDLSVTFLSTAPIRWPA